MQPRRILGLRTCFDSYDHAPMTGALRMSSEYDDLWRCRHCRRWFVVPSLARDHEQTCAERR